MRDSAYFDGVGQHEIVLDAGPCRLPAFGYDFGWIAADFPARYRALRKLLPDPRFVPARLAPGVGVVHVFCIEYRDTDVGPYNEVGIAIVLNHPSYRANLPARALIAVQRTGQSHAFVTHLPVTTEISREAGADLWGYPKFLAEIDFADEGPRRVCHVSKSGEHILTLSGERLQTGSAGQRQYFMHAWMERQPQLGEIRVNLVEVGESMRPGTGIVELGERHPIARELAGVLLARRSLNYEYVTRAEGILFAPEHVTPTVLEHELAVHAAVHTEAAA